MVPPRRPAPSLPAPVRAPPARAAEAVGPLAAARLEPPPRATDEPVGIEELTAVELLACLPQPAREGLARSARRRAYREGQSVFHEGEPGDTLQIVRRGLLAVVRPSRDPGLVLHHLAAGDAFGEVAVLSDGMRLASIVAVKDSETIEVAKVDLDRVLNAHPAVMRRMLGALARSLTLAREQLARQNSLLEAKVRERTADLRESQLELVRRLADATESRDDHTGAHITRMSWMCRELAVDAGLDGTQAELLLHAASMHDIGKIAIPDSVLLKPGPLEPDEWEVMKRHAIVGAHLLADSRSPVVQMAEVIARTHHEKWDGSGYPEGLRGEAIPLVSRICAVCDVFDALVSERPYKDAWPVEEALAELDRLAGTHLEPRLVQLFLDRRPDLRADG